MSLNERYFDILYVRIYKNESSLTNLKEKN